MENWSEIIAFTYPHEAHLAKSKLESEGIEVILKDELTTQVNNFYSNAIGGVKLLVKNENLDLAKKILTEGDFLHTTEQKPGAFLSWFNSFSSKLPLIGNTVIEFRLLAVVAFVAVLVLLLLTTLVG